MLSEDVYRAPDVQGLEQSDLQKVQSGARPTIAREPTMNFYIDIEFYELEINDSLYKRFFDEYMHMIKDRKYSANAGFMLITFESFCDKTTHLKIPESTRHASMYGIGFQELKLMPGFTEAEIRHTNVDEDVTCPHCTEGYVLSLLAELP